MRFFPRVKTDLLVGVNEKLEKSKVKIMDLSVNGAFLKGPLPSAGVGDTVFLKYDLPGYGLLEHNGRVIREDSMGVALIFYNLDMTTKMKLWKYITDNLHELNGCPYCGEKYAVLPPVCKACGWNLEFHSPAYFEYHEKFHLLKKLSSRADLLKADQIRRLINLLDVEILKGGGSEDFQEFVGTSEVMKKVFSKIRRVAPTDLPVLILGESGTGKEMTALAIHERGTRNEKVFVPINCAAIPETLLEAELFGYERGAFTGAYTSKIGKFEHADGGTLFLDEIGDLSPGLQAKLLRFLENQTMERIGAIRPKKVNVRLIAATNCNLESAIAQGRFRLDLYYRLDAFTIKLPPVRERGEDKIVLAKHFLEKFSREMGLSKTFTTEAVKALERYNWPGNVREIINKVRRAMVMSNGDLIEAHDLDIDIPEGPPGNGGLPKKEKGSIDRQRVKEVLGTCGRNISSAAKMLGVSRPTIYSLKRKYGI